MIALVLAANIFGWPLLHIAIGFVAFRIPPHLFARDTWLTASRSWERDGHIYRNWLCIRKWKLLLPDGGPWLGGLAKRKLLKRNPDSLAQFLIETRRAEIAHWCMLACLPVFFLWNPPWARWVMAAYALAANLPCILAQRYNRFVVSHVARTCCRVLARP